MLKTLSRKAFQLWLSFALVSVNAECITLANFSPSDFFISLSINKSSLFPTRIKKASGWSSNIRSNQYSNSRNDCLFVIN